ncbi:DEAD/DEAH box helicase [Viridibacterium curvum]|uniref:DEAD/DEAH box helicase n=1 Tax=Viridibacterium curvum TaxID=1101404 RepID=A0ABP9R8E0_9RHOO
MSNTEASINNEPQTSAIDAIAAFAAQTAAPEAAPEAAAVSGFAAFNLAPQLMRAIEGLGFTQPTPVQAEAIPAAMKGGDWMVSSQTGSGKTAAFLIPALNVLMGAEHSQLNAFLGPRVLVLCPTRELAQQVAQDAIDLVRHARGIRIATVVGGMPFGKQIQSLKGASVVIATPGRLLDLANRRVLRMDHTAALIVDEADRMLDLGFAEDLEAIHKLCEGRSQTMMFSATFAPRIMQLAARLMDEPGRLELASAQDKHADIAQTLHWVDGFAHKRKLLDHWLRDASIDQAIIFTSTQADADTLADELEAEGHSAAALHGAMPQAVRNRRLKSLRDGRIRVLVATDVAARGIDVPTISHVINYGLPMKAEDYVHRIGRTGRAGRSGTAVTLAEYRDRPKIMAIERYTQQRFNPSVIAGLEPTPRAPRGERPQRSFGDKPRSFGDRPRFGNSDGPRREFSDRPRREFSDRPARDFGDRPQRDFADRPPRSFGDAPRRFEERPRTDGERPRFDNDRPRREFNAEDSRPRRSEGDSRPPRRFDSEAPRRPFGGDGDSRPRFQPRGEGSADTPRRSFGDAPRRDFGDRQRPQGGFNDSRPRPAGGGDSRPARSFGDSRPQRDFSGDSRPARSVADSRPQGGYSAGSADSRPRPAGGGLGGGDSRPAPRKQFARRDDR